MATPISSLATSSPTKRPIGIIVAESYFLTFIALISFRLIADLDFYTRRASRMHLLFFQFFATPSKIGELSLGALCVFAVIGLQRLRPWGWWLAIALAGTAAAFTIWFCSAVLFYRMWTLVPHQMWPYVRGTIKLAFGIYIVWYLFQPETRQAFRPLQPPSANGSDSAV